MSGTIVCRGRFAGITWGVIATALFAGGWMVPGRASADVRPFAEEGVPEKAGLEILQEDPHDLIVFTDESGGGWVKVLPIPFPNRELPRQRNGVIPLQVMTLEGEEFVADWEDVKTIRLWERRLEEELRERINAEDFVGAYPFLAILIRDYPDRPNLKDLRTEFLWKDAISRAKRGEVAQTVGMLEELQRFAPEYRTDAVRRALSEFADRLMKKLLGENELKLAQSLLARLDDTFSDEPLPSVVKWKKEFRSQAEKRMAQAEDMLAREEFVEARRLSREAVSIDPSTPGAETLVRRVEKIYPLINVGVLQSATVLDPIRIDNWAARRAGRLVYRTLFEIQGPGPAGGEYEFIFGEVDASPDRQRYDLMLQPDTVRPPLDQMSSPYLADVLASRADRSSETYFAPWAAAVGSISIDGPKMLSFKLRRPNVLPTALLRVTVDGSWFGDEAGSPTGDYRLMSQDDSVTRFVLRGEPRTETQPRQIVEKRMESGSAAVAALLSGEIDVCDQLFPVDAVRLENAPGIRVGRYPLPTVHMLVPVSDHEFLADKTFRRALVYGTNRKDILEGELLGGREFEGCQVLSGPFPAGIELNDPLGYAYDQNLPPRSYEPPLARLLVELAKKQFEVAAERDKTDPPELKPLRLAHPDDNLSRTACEAIKSQWDLLGLQCTLVPLPAGRTFPDNLSEIADIAYVSAAVWEPFVDARRVVGPEGLAASDDQLIGLGLRRLENAINWKQVRDNLLQLHSITREELPIIPLWQMVDSYAHRDDLIGMGYDIVTLYQNADDWRIGQ